MRTFLILMRVQMHALIRSLTPGSRRIGMALAVVAGVLLVAFAAL